MISKFYKAIKIANFNNFRLFAIITISLLIAILELFGIGIFQSLLISILSPETIGQSPIFNLINKLTNLGGAEQTKFLIIFFCIFFILKNILSFIFNYYIFTLFEKFQQSILIKYFNFLVKKKQTFLNNADHVKQNQLISRYIDTLVKHFTLPFFRIFNEILIASFMVCFLIYSSLEVASISIIYLLFTSLIFIGFTSNKLKKNAKKISISEENMKKNIYEMINNYKEIFAYKISNLFFKKFKSNSSEFLRAEKIYSVISNTSKQFFEITLILLMVTLLLISNRSENMLADMAMLGTFGFAFIKLIPSFNIIVSSITSIKQASYAVNQIINFYDENLNNNKPETDENLVTDKNSKAHILKVKNLNFSYDDKKLILNNLNLEAKIGELIGIQGPSGSGKTTFVDVVLNLLKPQSGSVIICDYKDHEISKFDNFAYISQNVSIFNETIAYNITFTNEDIEKEKLNDVLKMVDLSNLIDRKDIFKDKIELDGKDLSGGQKQKIAIARAVYHDKQIILIDEATSNLDVASEKKFYDILKNVKKNKIILFITHKIRDEKIFDKIISIK